MNRVLHTAVLCGLSTLLLGCNEPKEPPIWEQVKIGDLTARHEGGPSQPQSLKSISLSVRIFEIPAENADKLGDVWQALYIRPVRFYNAYAFQANMFSVGYGDMRMSGVLDEALTEAGAQRIIDMSTLLADGETQDMTIVPLRQEQPLSYIDVDGSREQARVGPGIISLRIKAVKVPGTRDSCSLVAAPAFAVPMQSSIPQLADRFKAREKQFNAAAFGVRMSPGDIAVLGPSVYISDDTMLPGLFFSNPQGGPFPGDSKAALPKPGPAVRVFAIVCTGVR